MSAANCPRIVVCNNGVVAFPALNADGRLKIRRGFWFSGAQEHSAPIVVSDGKFGVEPDRLVEVFDGFVVLILSNSGAQSHGC